MQRSKYPQSRSGRQQSYGRQDSQEMLVDIPRPAVVVEWAKGLPIHEALSTMKDFQLCIRDMVERTGALEEDVNRMLGTNDKPNLPVFQEFAKCFIPEVIDPINNYELYEMSGDMALNKATFTYLVRILQPILASKEASKSVGYIDKLKAHYVSKKFYSTLTLDLGFDEFIKRVCYSNQQSMAVYFSEPNKKMEDLYEDVMEAFIGCLEIQIDRYMGMHRGYVYVANFVFDILSNKKIDFRPDSYWGTVSLLKETNDKIKARNNQYGNKNVIPFFRIFRGANQLYKIEYSQDVRSIRDEQKSWNDYREINPITADTKEEAEKKLSKILLEHLSAKPEYTNLIQRAPTAAQIGVESLITED